MRVIPVSQSVLATPGVVVESLVEPVLQVRQRPLAPQRKTPGAERQRQASAGGDPAPALSRLHPLDVRDARLRRRVERDPEGGLVPRAQHHRALARHEAGAIEPQAVWAGGQDERAGIDAARVSVHGDVHLGFAELQRQPPFVGERNVRILLEIDSQLPRRPFREHQLLSLLAVALASQCHHARSGRERQRGGQRRAPHQRPVHQHVRRRQPGLQRQVRQPRLGGDELEAELLGLAPRDGDLAPDRQVAGRHRADHVRAAGHPQGRRQRCPAGLDAVDVDHAGHVRW